MKTLAERIDDVLRLWWLASEWYRIVQHHPISDFMEVQRCTAACFALDGPDHEFAEAANNWIELDNQYRAAVNELVPQLEAADHDTTLLIKSVSMQQTNAARMAAGPDLEAWLKRVKMKLPHTEENGKRGRPRKHDEKSDQRIADAWATHEYRDYDDLGRAFGMTGAKAKQAVDRARKRK